MFINGNSSLSVNPLYIFLVFGALTFKVKKIFIEIDLVLYYGFSDGKTGLALSFFVVVSFFLLMLDGNFFLLYYSYG